MQFEITDWSFLIYVAAVTQFVGFIFRDQIVLRFSLLIGTILYISYYFLAPAEPLWDAILTATALGIANISMLAIIIFDRFTVLYSEEEKILYRMFYGFSPTTFRKLLNAGELKESSDTTVLAEEHKMLDKLYFVIDNGINIKKDGKTFLYMPGVFVGEVVYLSGGVSSATVSIQAHTSYIVWEHAKLNALTKKNPELKINLKSMLSQDMAKKIRYS